MQRVGGPELARDAHQDHVSSPHALMLALLEVVGRERPRTPGGLQSHMHEHESGSELGDDIHSNHMLGRPRDAYQAAEAEDDRSPPPLKRSKKHEEPSKKNQGHSLPGASVRPKWPPGGPCSHCGITQSPQWRRPSDNPFMLLCNACGIAWGRNKVLPVARRQASRSVGLFLDPSFKRGGPTCSNSSAQTAQPCGVVVAFCTPAPPQIQTQLPQIQTHLPSALPQGLLQPQGVPRARAPVPRVRQSVGFLLSHPPPVVQQQPPAQPPLFQAPAPQPFQNHSVPLKAFSSGLPPPLQSQPEPSMPQFRGQESFQQYTGVHELQWGGAVQGQQNGSLTQVQQKPGALQYSRRTGQLHVSEPPNDTTFHSLQNPPQYADMRDLQYAGVQDLQYGLQNRQQCNNLQELQQYVGMQELQQYIGMQDLQHYSSLASQQFAHPRMPHFTSQERAPVQWQQGQAMY
mmetsp:Transcript_19073/g.32676  ORF Transcript_19073/g.32676 Transcript_19073/m.32676 type:complete len:458 (-) Transcript_19073:1457-2830(-)